MKGSWSVKINLIFHFITRIHEKIRFTIYYGIEDEISVAVKAKVSFSLRLIGSAIYGSSFNLVTRVGLPYFLEH